MVDPAETVGAGSRQDAAGEDARRSGTSPPRPDIRDLVVQHYQPVYRYAYRLSGCAQEAEDLAQQTFLRAQRKLHQLREPEKADRWLFAILRNAYLKGRRRHQPLTAASLQLNVDEVPEDAVRRVERDGVDEEQLQIALNEIPDDFRLILLMFYFEELSYKEIAAKLEIPIGTVMSRLSRAKARLRERLTEPADGGHANRRAAEKRSRRAATRAHAASD